jgi:hypothetical protein
VSLRADQVREDHAHQLSALVGIVTTRTESALPDTRIFESGLKARVVDGNSCALSIFTKR